MNESDLKTTVLKGLDSHFMITPEAEGVFEFEGEKRKVIADFLIEPNEILINDFDFPRGKYIIEVKYLNYASVPDLSNLFIQCMTYKYSKFFNEHPVGVFIYTNLDYTLFPPTNDSRMLEVLLNTFGRINIGRLEIVNNDFSFILYNKDILVRYKQNQYKKARRDLLSISFGSGNNKLQKKY